jgi:4-amino-4-deoxy-L-arabinose transferase-like glycosyltransferase
MILLILSIGIILRVWDLGVIPSWDYDEGVNINIAWNLVHGSLSWFNLEYTFVPHPPLFFIAAGAFLKIFGNDLLVLRALTALYGILTLILLYLMGREFLNEKMGLLISFLFAIYPNAIFFGRIGFANNQLMLLSVLTLYSLLKYFKHRTAKWAYLASLSAGLASVTEASGIIMVLSVGLVFLVYDRKKLLRVLFISSAPFALFFFSMLVISPHSFIHDINYQFERLRTTEKVNTEPFSNILGVFLLVFFIVLCYGSRKKIAGIYRNIAFFIASCFSLGIESSKREQWMRDNLTLVLFSLNLFAASMVFGPVNNQAFFNGIPDYFLFGFIGLFLIKAGRTRNTILLFLAPQVLLFFKIKRSDHMLIPFYPYLALGLAVLLYTIYVRVKSSEKLRILSIPVALLLAAPFAVILCNDVSAFILGQGINVERPDDRIQAADYVNRNTNATDVVIANCHTARFIKARVSEFAIAYVTDNRKFSYMDYTLGPERFAFNSSPRNAKFFIADEDLEELKKTEKYSNLVDVLTDLENWSCVRIGRNYVYRNPRIP